jgi:hypothetical protein
VQQIVTADCVPLKTSGCLVASTFRRVAWLAAPHDHALPHRLIA